MNMARREDNVAINLDHLLNFSPKPAPGAALGTLYSHLETKSADKLAAGVVVHAAPMTIAKLDAAPVIQKTVVVHTVDDIVAPVFHLEQPAVAVVAAMKAAPVESKRSTSSVPPMDAPMDIVPVESKRSTRAVARKPVRVLITNRRSDGNGFCVTLADKSLQRWPKDKYEEYIEETKHGYLLR